VTTLPVDAMIRDADQLDAELADAAPTATVTLARDLVCHVRALVGELEAAENAATASRLESQAMRVVLWEKAAEQRALLKRLQWCNVNSGMAYILMGVEYGQIGRVLREAASTARREASDGELEG